MNFFSKVIILDKKNSILLTSEGRHIFDGGRSAVNFINILRALFCQYFGAKKFQI